MRENSGLNRPLAFEATDPSKPLSLQEFTEILAETNVGSGDDDKYLTAEVIRDHAKILFAMKSCRKLNDIWKLTVILIILIVLQRFI